MKFFIALILLCGCTQGVIVENLTPPDDYSYSWECHSSHVKNETVFSDVCVPFVLSNKSDWFTIWHEDKVKVKALRDAGFDTAYTHGYEDCRGQPFEVCFSNQKTCVVTYNVSEVCDSWVQVRRLK